MTQCRTCIDPYYPTSVATGKYLCILQKRKVGYSNSITSSDYLDTLNDRSSPLAGYIKAILLMEQRYSQLYTASSPVLRGDWRYPEGKCGLGGGRRELHGYRLSQLYLCTCQFKLTTDKGFRISPEEQRALDLTYAIEIPVTAHSKVIAKTPSLSFVALRMAAYT